MILFFCYRTNYLLFGLQPLWFHITNVLLHSVASILFTRVCLCVAGLKPPFATLAGLLFAVHPIHTEAVSISIFANDIVEKSLWCRKCYHSWCYWFADRKTYIKSVEGMHTVLKILPIRHTV